MVSCTTTEEGMDRTEVLQVSTSKIDIDAIGGDDSFTITSHCDWSTEVLYPQKSDNWITLSSTNGKSGTKKVTVTFDENKSLDDRCATITVSNDRYALSQSIEIHQKAGKPFILLDQSDKEVAADGELIELIVDSNIDYTISSSESWARTSVSSASKGEKKIYISVDSSPVVESRSATITFSGKEHDVSATFKIIQQKLVPFIDIDAKYITCEAEGETVSIAIESNISWNASCTSDWLTITPATGEKGTSTFGVEVAANPMTTIREAVINVSNAEYNIEKQVTITQKALVPRLSVNTEPISATAEGRTRDINIDANISWQASCDADWVTITPTNGEKGLSNIMVKVDENAKTTVRETVVKVFNSEYNVEKQIAISQEAFGPVLDVDHESISATAEGRTRDINIDANISWRASCDADWVTITPTNGKQGFSILTVVVAPHTNTTSRKTVIKVSNSVYDIEKQITISQDAMPVNAILYTSSYKVTPYSADAFGASIVSNTYENGQGTIVFDAPITSIGDYAFYECWQLESITIPDSVTSIGDHAFSYCRQLKSITIPDSVTSIGDYAFYECSLESITIPNSVTLIGCGTFWGCDFESIIIPDSVTSIGDYAFYDCYSLTSVTIPNSVTTIGAYAFRECSSLARVYCKATTPPSLGDRPFYNNTSDFKIYVPAALVNAYKSASGWSSWYAPYIVGYNF